MDRVLQHSVQAAEQNSVLCLNMSPAIPIVHFEVWLPMSRQSHIPDSYPDYITEN